MNTLKAFGKSVFFWFTSYLLIYLCFSIVTAVMAAHAGMDYPGMMLRTLPLYCMVSAIISTVGTVMYAKEIGLIQKEVITDNEDYDPAKTEHDGKQIHYAPQNGLEHTKGW